MYERVSEIIYNMHIYTCYIFVNVLGNHTHEFYNCTTIFSESHCTVGVCFLELNTALSVSRVTVIVFDFDCVDVLAFDSGCADVFEFDFGCDRFTFSKSLVTSLFSSLSVAVAFTYNWIETAFTYTYVYV